MKTETPELPYYAVIFTSKKTGTDEIGYEEMADKMFSLAATQEGFLGVESARNEIGITVSYWKTQEDILNWKKNIEHLIAQKMGIEKWYQFYTVRICKVERQYSFEK